VALEGAPAGRRGDGHRSSRAAPDGSSSAASTCRMRESQKGHQKQSLMHFGQDDAMILSPAAAFETVRGDPKTWQRMYALKRPPLITALNRRDRQSASRCFRTARIVNVRRDWGALKAGSAWAPTPPPSRRELA